MRVRACVRVCVCVPCIPESKSDNSDSDDKGDKSNHENSEKSGNEDEVENSEKSKSDDEIDLDADVEEPPRPCFSMPPRTCCELHSIFSTVLSNDNCNDGFGMRARM